MTGVNEQVMAFQHKFAVEMKDGMFGWNTKIKEGYSNRKEADALRVGFEPVKSVIEKFNSDGQYTEADCGIPKKGQCRFDSGKDISLTIGQWMAIGDVHMNQTNDNVR